MLVVIAKILAAVILFLATLVSGASVRWSLGLVKKPIWFAGMQSFSVGAFSALLLIEFFPELLEMEEATMRKSDSKLLHSIPLAAIFAFIGVMIMFSTEMWTHKRGHSHNHHQHHHHHIQEAPQGILSTVNIELNAESSEAERTSSSSSIQKRRPSTTTEEAKPLDFVILLVVMAVHSFCEGLPVGMKSEAAGVWKIFFPLLLHKAIEAATIGSGLMKMEKKKAFLCLAIYSAMTPVGIMAGEAATSVEGSLIVDILSLFLMGVASGTMIFLTFVEWMSPQVESEDLDSLFKVLTTIAGFTVIAVFSVVMKVSFDHDHQHI